MLNAHTAPSPAGDLTDPLAKAWWHHNVPAMHWHPSFGTSNNAAMLPALIQVQHRLVDLLNTATEALPTGSTPEQRVTAIKTVLSSWNEELRHASDRSMAGEPTWYDPFMVLANENRIPLATLLTVTKPDRLAPALDWFLRHPAASEGLGDKTPNLNLVKNRLVQTFGLQGLAMDQTLLPAEHQVERLKSLERSLSTACDRLGIAPAAWGAVAPMLTVVSWLNEVVPQGAAGVYQGYHREIAMRDARSDAEKTDTLVHEWAHAFDNGLLRRHNVPGIRLDEYASSFVARTTVQERQAMNLPEDLQRSLAIVARIVDEMKGHEAPLLERGRVARLVAKGMGQRWLKAAQGYDARQGEDYYAQDHEMFARLVENGHVKERSLGSLLGISREVSLERWGLPLGIGNGFIMAGRRPKGTLHLFDELIRNEQLAAGPRPANSPIVTHAIGQPLSVRKLG